MADGATATAAPANYQDDPDFKALPLGEKHKAMLSMDSDYAGLPPQEQQKALKAIHYGPDPEMPSNNSRQANEFLLGAASGASGLKETQDPIPDTASALANANDVNTVGLPKTARGAPSSDYQPGPVSSYLGPLGGLLETGKSLFSPAKEGEDPEDVAERRAHAAGTVTGMAGTGMIGEGVARAPEVAARVGEVRGNIGNAIHEPETGDLTPAAQRKSELVGAGVGTVAGGGAGLMGGHPVYGAMSGGAIGHRLAPGLMETMFPESAERVAARNDPYARIAPGPQVPKGGLPVPKPGPYDIRAAGPEVPKGGLPGQSVGSPITIPEIPEPSVPSSRKAPVLEGEGRPATWTNEKVKELASWGDPDAIEQARNRGFGRIPQRFSATQLNPREVVKFDENGAPVNEGESVGQPIEQNAPKAQPQGLGKSRLAEETPPARTASEKYTPEELEDAHTLIEQELGMMASGERPGHIPIIEENEGAGSAGGVQGTSIGGWQGVGSMRNMLPFMKENPKFSPQMLSKALVQRKGAVYERAMDRAVDFIRREKMTPEERGAMGQAGMKKNGALNLIAALKAGKATQ